MRTPHRGGAISARTDRLRCATLSGEARQRLEPHRFALPFSVPWEIRLNVSVYGRARRTPRPARVRPALHIPVETGFHGRALSSLFLLPQNSRASSWHGGLRAETPAPPFARLGAGIFVISCRALRVVRGGSVDRPCAGCRAPGQAGPSLWLGRRGQDRWAARGRARNPARRRSSRLDPKRPHRTDSTAAAPAGGRSSSTGPESWNSRATRSSCERRDPPP